jgi:hypothetical protein
MTGRIPLEVTTMNIGTISRQALRAVSGESVENRILVSKKIIKEIEDTPNEASHRLCQDLRATLKSVITDPSATGEQVHECGSLLARVRAFDPRRNPKATNAVEPAELDPVKPRSLAPPVPDGFERGFVDPIAAVERVTAKFGQQQPSWTDLWHIDLLQTAIGGGIAVDEHSVRQLWHAMVYDFKERLGCVEGSLVPQAKWITSSICAFANKHGISIPTPNCFSSVFDELSFRS